MTNKNIEELKKMYGSESVIYLTGSRLTGVANQHSDYDYYMFYLPTKTELLLKDNNRGTTYHGENFEAKVFMLPQFLKLVSHLNPNVAEFLYRKPEYVSPKLKDFTDDVFNNVENLVSEGRAEFVRSAVGMLKGSKATLRPDKVYTKSGTFGKTLYNFDKAYRYAKGVYEGRPLANEIFLSGKDLEHVKYLKSLKEYNADELEKQHVDEKLTELQEIADNIGDRGSKTFNELLKEIPLTR